MSRRSLPVLLLLLLAIALGIGWLVRTVTSDAPIAPAAVESLAPAAPAAPAADAPPTAPSLALAPAPDAPAPVQIESTTADEREAIEKDPEGIDMTQVWTVAGRVQLPPGTPPDERVQVVAAVGNPRRPKIHSRSDLGADGSFSVSFSQGAEKGQLLLEARFVYLAIPHEVSPAGLAKLAGPIVLRPELGGCIHAKLVLPRNALDHRDSVAGTSVHLGGRLVADPQDWSNQLQRETKVDENLEFEFGGLPAARVYNLSLRPKDLVDASLESLRIENGRVLPVSLDLQLGARVAGKIVDEKGVPLEKVEVAIGVEHGMSTFTHPTDEGTAADGTYSAGGIHPGKVTLQFSKTGYSPLRQELGRLVDGDVRSGLEGVLRRGLSVAGRVLWPDERPAAGARVEYRATGEADDDEIFFSTRGNDSFTTKEDGTFEISGLDKRSIVVTALAEVPDAEPPAAEPPAAAKGSDAPPGAPTPAKAKRTWKARIEDVAPGTKDLVLRLAEGATIRGRAVDDQGAPLAAFRVRAEPADGTQPWERRQRAPSASGKDGEFAIEGLHAGDWDVIAEAKDHTSSSPRRVRVPGDAEKIELVLPRGAKVSGTVVDREGKAVPRARAVARVADAASRFEPWNRDDKKAQSDEEGRFEIANVPPGPVKLVATGEGLAASAPLAIELAPGLAVADLTLVLRVPGRITGEVVDDAGRPIPGRMIHMNGMEQEGNWSETCDAAGSFVIEGLAPGRYWISSPPSEKELEADDPEEKERDEMRWARHQKQASAVVEEGGTTHVVLGGIPKDGVKVHGTIYAGSARDRTVPACTLWTFKRNAAEASAPITGSSDSEGKYEVVVPGAGDYSVSIMSQKRGTTTSMQFTVPKEKETFEHDLVLPGGRIAGRVLKIDGKPAPGVSVSCAPEVMTAALSGDASYGNTTSDEAGAFAFDGLNAGTYRFEAGSQPWMNLPSTTGKCVRGGVVLETDGRISNLELRLLPECRVEGIVLGPDGQPVAGASVFARDEQGNLVQRWPPVSADASGRFVIDGLLPGKTTFAARTKKLASPETAPVDVKPGETAKVEITLRTGTRLVVVVREKDERVVGSFVSIADARGRDMTLLYAFQDAGPFGESNASEGQRIGPVPPGRYRLTAKNHDGSSTSEEVSVSGEEEVVVNLRFEG